MTSVLVPLADGFEEIEAITIIDVLRRAGIKVFEASIGSRGVVGAHGIKIDTENTLESVKETIFEAVVLPGGMPGTTNLLKSQLLKDILQKHHKTNKLVAAICAAPWVLSECGILQGKTATIYPGFEEKFKSDTLFSQDKVVISDNVITSRGPGTSMEFSLTLVSKLISPQKSEQLRQGMVVA